MVSQITTGFPTDDHGRPFRRRRYIPFAIVTVVLLVAGIVIWASALADGDSSTVNTSCNQPPAPSADPSAAAGAPTSAAAAPSLTTVPAADLIDVAPGALSTFQVRVLNASAQRGQARTVLDDLTSQGFTPATDTPYADDTIYDQNLACVGQIRFGQASRAAAAALWLAEPCAELIDDGRSGAVVDLVLGTAFTSKEQSQDAQAALESLRSADPKNPKTGADPSLVRAVHNSSC